MKPLQQLAISEEGIAFDPTTGETYTLNPTGAITLRHLARGMKLKDIAAELAGAYCLSVESIERDLNEFTQQVKLLGFVGGAR